MKLIGNKNWKESIRELLNILKDEKIILNDLSFKDNEIDIIQKNILEVSKTKEEINLVIKMTKRSL